MVVTKIVEGHVYGLGFVEKGTLFQAIPGTERGRDKFIDNFPIRAGRADNLEQIKTHPRCRAYFTEPWRKYKLIYQQVTYPAEFYVGDDVPENGRIPSPYIEFEFREI